MVHPARSDDGNHVVPNHAEPAANRSDAGQNDEDYAVCLLVYVLPLPCRPGAVLCGEQSADHRAAMVCEPQYRTAT